MDIKTELHMLIEKVGNEFENFPWEDKKAYGHWLAQTYYFVRHTTCFLALTASRWGVKNRTQQYRALKHLKEESSHDLLLLNDLEAIKDSINNHTERPETQAFYQTQYYWIEHETPAAHWGYAYLLEGLASKKALMAYNRIIKAHGNSTASFLKTHAEEDSTHFEEGLKNLEHLNKYEMDCFRDCLRQAAMLYLQILSGYKTKS
ncbi:MAG: iron-containing redox enzyme family protein [Bdellovibrionota bacterium]